MMTDTKQSNNYSAPLFQTIGDDESDKVFFATSGTPGSDPKSLGAELMGIGNW